MQAYHIEIYQLKNKEENHLRQWVSYDSLGKMAEIPMLSNYELVYEIKQPSKPNLKDFCRQFNRQRPADFTGHPLSVSDIIVVKGMDEQTAYYINNFGFIKIPDFIKQLNAKTENIWHNQ